MVSLDLDLPELICNLPSSSTLHSLKCWKIQKSSQIDIVIKARNLYWYEGF